MASSVVGNNAFLKVSPAELNSKANEVNAQIQTMEGLMTEMSNNFKTVNENWQSTSGDQYIEKANTLMTEIKESLDNLQFYVKDLTDAAAKYEDLESEIQGKVGALEDPSSIFNI